jgi:hypothetical protein
MRAATEQHQAATIASANEHLTPIAVKILEMRVMFLDHLDSLLPPFNEQAKQHYLTRLVRAEDRHMLGEYAPFLLSDVLRIPDKALSDIIIPWLVIYQHNLLVDDIVDVKGQLISEEILLSQVLFDNFVSLWRNRFSKHPDLWQLFSKYHGEWILATFKELRKSSEISAPLVHDSIEWATDYHLTMGHKSALVKFCAAALSIEYKGRFLSPGEEIAFDKLCAGIQLLDDLSDSIEDYREKRYTYPLMTGFEWLQRRHDLTSLRQRTLSDEEILSVLILSGVTGQVVKLSRGYLAEGVSDLQITPDSPTGKYLLSLIEDNSRIAKTLDSIITTNSSLIERMIHSLCEREGAFEDLLTDPTYESIWKEMKRCFKPVATASN